ncbi:MAG: PQQ-binding-like beta-propeller repeat protein, partial [Planctomycetaceae bacterium]|nr:PQQ-binding-like beta-propeller repeat protein [Planctomycetaceae bacterium]
GIATCFNTKDGDAVFGPVRIRNASECFASPVYGDGKIYVAAENGNIVVLRDADEIEVLAVNDMGSPVLGSPAIADGALFVRTRAALMRLEDSQVSLRTR